MKVIDLNRLPAYAKVVDKQNAAVSTADGKTSFAETLNAALGKVNDLEAEADV